MKVAALCDGISCGMVALQRVNIPVEKYISSEIDKNAIKVSEDNHSGIVRVGDIKKYHCLEWIDLILAGTPCQGFSKAGKQLNFKDERSALFFEAVRILNEARQINPDVLFLFENVKMKKEYQDIISEVLGVKPILINSGKVSAQNRERLYWTNIPGITQPEDRCIELKDIIESGDVDKDKSYCIDANYFKGTTVQQYLCKNRRQIVWKIPEATKKGYVEVTEGQCIELTFIKSNTRRGRLMLKKSNCLTATNYRYCKVTKDWFRMLTPVECERLQTLPDGYTKAVSNMHRYKCLGNGWTIDVISHILSFIPLDVVNKKEDGIPSKTKVLGILPDEL